MAVKPNYEDPRFTKVESDKQQAMTDLEQTYSGMIGETDKYYQAQIDASKQWADKQQQIQQEQTDFTLEKIEQEKAKAERDYTKQQSGAYVDWQKQSNEYGSEAEKMAASGLQNTGFSESSQVAMYNAYQGRVATANQVFNDAIMNFNNSMKEAMLQNNSVLAEIAFQAQKEQLELALEGFQYKNNLLLEQANKKLEVDQMYHQRYQDVLAQVNWETQMAEEIRQYNQQYQLQIDQFNEEKRQFTLEYNESIRQFNEEIARLKAKDAQEYKLQIQELELKKQQAAEAKRQFEKELALKQSQLAEEKRQFDLAYSKSSSSGSISKSKSSSGGSGSVKKAKSSISSGAASVKKSASNTSKSSTPTNNMQSIIDLGMGPISASKLASLVSSGQVSRTLKNGQYYYYKNTGSSSYNRLKNMGLSK